MPSRLIFLSAIFFASIPLPSAAGPVVRNSTPDEAVREIRGERRQVITFMGYSGAGYEHGARVAAKIRSILIGKAADKILVNAGATEVGIGMVYQIAKSINQKILTAGIVSSQSGGKGLSAHADKVFVITDGSWGGFLPGTSTLSPTSQAMIRSSHEIHVFGGGQVSAEEAISAHRNGIKVYFYNAEMNHAIAIEKARKKGEAAPSNFEGAAAQILKTTIGISPF